MNRRKFLGLMGESVVYPALIHFIPRTANAYRYLNEQTIESNKVQSYRNAAQKELADWIRFSNKDAEKYQDGLTPGFSRYCQQSEAFIRLSPKKNKTYAHFSDNNWYTFNRVHHWQY